ncbi:MAG TPA: universal stress protein [Candidatus Desulfofervidus auxilii]|uniref:Universal stress protein n=1 Tax=Desulfofervidus auxilii TaxID=1621989 RepID=A0A7V0NE14_DESA2|nr:universal stress protein [Candidatus Desulfofervidus auxilii]
MAKKILVAIDGSEPSMKAVRYVGETVKGCKDVKIVLFSVLPEMPKGLDELLGTDYVSVVPHIKERLGDLGQLRLRQEEEMKKALENAKEVLKSAGIPEKNIEIAVRRKKEGIAKDILREVESGHYDTIVVGRRGISGAFFFGSVSDKVIKYAHNCAVWVID